MICKQGKSAGGRQGGREKRPKIIMRVRERTGRAGRRHLAGRQLPDSAGLESRGSCLPPCTSSITAYFPPPPTNHTRRWRGEKIQSFPASQSSAGTHSFTSPPKPAGDRPPGRQEKESRWVGWDGGGVAEPGFLRYDSNQGWGERKSPTGRPRNKWHRAFGGAGNGFESFKQFRSCCSVNQD